MAAWFLFCMSAVRSMTFTSYKTQTKLCIRRVTARVFRISALWESPPPPAPISDKKHIITMTTTGSENLSYGQYVTLVATFSLTSCLSIAASVLLIYMSWGKIKTQIYHRLVCGLSFSTISFAIGGMLQSYLLPADTLGAPFAVGDQSTCSMVGFVTTWGQMGIAFYNAILSVFFCLLVRNTRQSKYEQALVWRFELPAHVLAIVILTGFCLVALMTESYNKGAVVDACILAAYPTGCEHNPDVDCLRGELGPLLMKVRVLLIVLVSIIAFTAILIVYWTVRKQLSQNNRLSFHMSLNEERNRQIQQVRYQAVWYGIIYFNFTIWPFINMLITSVTSLDGNRKGEPQFFMMFLVMYFMLGIQGEWFPPSKTNNAYNYCAISPHMMLPFAKFSGVFNFLVFIRPTYSQWRAQAPHASSFFIVRNIVGGESLEEYRKSRRNLLHHQQLDSPWEGISSGVPNKENSNVASVALSKPFSTVSFADDEKVDMSSKKVSYVGATAIMDTSRGGDPVAIDDSNVDKEQYTSAPCMTDSEIMSLDGSEAPDHHQLDAGKAVRFGNEEEDGSGTAVDELGLRQLRVEEP